MPSFSSYTSFPPPTRERKMSISETYFLAHTARAKLAREAQRSDHNLRLLVGHANMLDGLMLDLADAEKEQEAWFDQSVRRAADARESKGKHIQWADRAVRTPLEDEDWDTEDALLTESECESDSDNESDYDRFFVDVAPTPETVPAAPATPAHSYDDEDLYDDDLEEDYEELTLTRTNSHSHSHSHSLSNQPPELLSDDESEDEEPSPPSPPQLTFDDFSSSGNDGEAIVPSAFYTSKQPTPAATPPPTLSQPALLDGTFFLPTPGPERIIEAF